MSEAQVTSESRKIVPLNVSGITSQSGRRNSAVTRMAAHTASPRSGNASSSAGNLRLAITFAAIAVTSITATMKTRAHSTLNSEGACLTIGE